MPATARRQHRGEQAAHVWRLAPGRRGLVEGWCGSIQNDLLLDILFTIIACGAAFKRIGSPGEGAIAATAIRIVLRMGLSSLHGSIVGPIVAGV